MSVYILTGMGQVGKRSIHQETQKQLQRSPAYVFLPLLSQEQGFTDADAFVSYKDQKNMIVGYSKKDMAEALEAGKKVIVSIGNVALISDMIAKLEGCNVNVILVAANADILAERKSKSKEVAEIKKVGKVLKKQLEKFQASLAPIGKYREIINDTTIEEAADQFATLLGFDPKVDIPPPDENDLKNCLPQDYLKRVIFPHLGPGLTLLDQIRPNDPVHWLAVYLIQEANVTKEKLMELENAKRIRQDLRREVASDFNVQGRI